MLRVPRPGRSLRFLILVVATCAAAPEGLGGAGPLARVKPFREPIELRYRPMEHFTYGWRTDISAPGRPTVIAEGWVMQGSVKAKGDRLVWSYTLSNFGPRRVLLHAGTLEVTTDPWGKVIVAHVLSNEWAKNVPLPGGESKYFDAQDLVFPLCCCPEEPLHMGDVLKEKTDVQTMPIGPMPDDSTTSPPVSMTVRRRSAVAGVLAEDGGTEVVIRHRARGSVRDPEGTAQLKGDGYTLLDIRTCLPRHSVWRTTVSLKGRALTLTRTSASAN